MILSTKSKVQAFHKVQSFTLVSKKPISKVVAAAAEASSLGKGTVVFAQHVSH